MRDWIDELVFIVFSALILLMALVYFAHAHEHMPGESDAQKRVVDFYKNWHRPKGTFGVTHRLGYCCYGDGARQDCFPVAEIRRGADGGLEAMPDVTGTHSQAQNEYGYKWYKLNTKVDEALQPDPLTSPDARAHMCIANGQVICYVGPAGS